ncbi:MAG: hypothetical protein HW421_2733 [Ignavibacteria bacterium]|nr:hypothetical protein [Ignavibacteria bacterium]
MLYKIKVKKSKEGYSVWCEDSPGYASQGNTEEEAIHNIKEAIEDYCIVRNEIMIDEKLILVEV